MSIASHLKTAIDKHKSKTSEKTKVKSATSSNLRSMEIEPAENEGYIVTHRQSDSGGMGNTYKEPTKHAIKNHKDLMKHVKEHFGPEQEDAKEEK